METSLFNRLQLALLGLVSTGLVLLAVLNFLQERHSQQPDDGVWWREASDGKGLVADRVLPDGPGVRAGIRAGDRLTGVNILPVGAVGSGHRKGIRPQEPLAGVQVMPEEARSFMGERALETFVDIYLHGILAEPEEPHND